jgi:hypothetical protein
MNDAGGELWVLTPTYKRACYLEGKITSASSGQPINGALVEILSSTLKESTTSAGEYTLGQANPGTVQVKVSKIGYDAVTTSATLEEGEVTVLDVALTDATSVSVSGQVLDAGSGLPVPNAHVTVYNNQINFETTANASGQFIFPAVYLGTYSVVAGAWGHLYAQKNNQNIQANQAYTLELDKGYRDDFIFDYGWEVSGTSLTGVWERGEPVGVNPGILLSPETDWGSDIGDQCYVTGNSTSAVDEDDVESGTMILRSPPMDLTYLNAPVLRGFLFFVSITQDQQSLDSIKLYVSNGLEEQLLLNLPSTNFTWKILNEPLKPKIAITNNMRIRIECFDNPAYLGFDSYEAAFDFFRIIEGNPVGTNDPALEATLTVRPNPFKGSIFVEYKAPAAGSYRLALYDVLGRQVEAATLEGAEGMAVLGQSLHEGIYFARLEQEGQASRPVRIVKID